jgi:hypothetical protein
MRFNVVNMVTRRINQPEAEKDRQVTFKCKFCGEVRPLNEMVRMTRFFPPVVACSGCAKKMERMGG